MKMKLNIVMILVVHVVITLCILSAGGGLLASAFSPSIHTAATTARNGPLCTTIIETASTSQRISRHPSYFGPIDDKQNKLYLSSSSETSSSEEIEGGGQKGEELQQDRLLSLLDFIQNREKGRLPCGLDANEKEQELVASVIAEVEQDSGNNLVTMNNGIIEAKDLFGDWQLLYTSSRTMIINKSLSGLGRSTSDLAQFVSLVQKLGGNKYIGNAEFVEQFGKGDSKLEVFITGEWFTKRERNPFTGKPCTAIEVQLEKVMYGPSTNSAGDWNSLGPIKLLDVLYLSTDMMISRVNVKPDSMFVWKRI